MSYNDNDRDWKAEFEREQKEKRSLANELMNLVELGRHICFLHQPAVLSKTQKESNDWAKFYNLLNKSSVVLIDGETILTTN